MSTKVIGYEVETEYSKDRINSRLVTSSDGSIYSKETERTEISLARTIIHEGIHAEIALTPSLNDDDNHNLYSSYQSKILNALVEYNRENKLGYNHDDLEAISWVGTTSSDKFKEYIQGHANKNGTTYEQEYDNWTQKVHQIEYKNNEVKE